MTVTTDKPTLSAAEMTLLVTTLASTYLVSQLLRNSIGVIAPDLASEMNMPASQMGILASAFFFAFAAAQIPLGIAIDRYGPKLCMLVCAVVVVVGAGLFAFARTPIELIAARVLMGLGTSCYLMAPLAYYARRFPAERFATLAGLQLGLGTIGTLLATAPFAFAAAAIGWRASFVVIGLGMALTGVLTAVAVEEAPAPPDARRETLRESLIGLREALMTPSVGRLFLMQMVAYSSFVFFVGLWGGPYFTHVYGYDLKERGLFLLIPALAQTLGLMVYGPMDQLFGRYRTPVLIGALATASLLMTLAFFGSLPPLALIVWLALFGACSAWTPVLIAHGKALFQPRLVGRGLSLLNMGSMGGVFLVQSVSGFAIDLFPASDGVYPAQAYGLVFALQGAFILIATLFYFGARDPISEKKN